MFINLHLKDLTHVSFMESLISFSHCFIETKKQLHMPHDVNTLDAMLDEHYYMPFSPSCSTTITLTSPVPETEREMLFNEMDSLRQERESLLLEVKVLKSYSFPLDALSVKEDSEQYLILVGLSRAVFVCLLGYLGQYQKIDARIRVENMENQILLTLVKLKHNLTFDMLPHLKCIGKTTAIDIFWKWIDIMYSKMKFLIQMQDRDYIFQTIPAVFKQKFPRVTSIIDCFEIFIESPGNLLANAQCYSQ